MSEESVKPNSSPPASTPVSSPSDDDGSIASFNSALNRLLENSVVEVMEALETLLVYIRNLILLPHEKKYRKIKISNIHYQERLGHLSGALEAMNSIGYLPVGDYLRLDEKKIQSQGNQHILKQLETIVNNQLNNVRSQWNNLPLRTASEHNFSSVAAAGSHSAIGKRHNMEDDEIIIDKYCGFEYCGYFGLYDGHGGRATVDFVVKALHMNLEQHLKRNPNDSLPNAFKQSYLATDGQLRRQNILRSGTTSVTCVVTREKNSNKRMLFTANVGDSRAVLCRQGKAMRLTIDHKASLPEEAKRITDAGGFIGRNKRVNGVLAISRALGDHMLKENDVVSAEPYVCDTELTPEDSHILLACDGVWDVMTDQEAIDFMLQKIDYYTRQMEEKKGDANSNHNQNNNNSNNNSTASSTENSKSADSAMSEDSTNSSNNSVLSNSSEDAQLSGGHNAVLGEFPRNLNEVMHFTAKALVREALDRKSLDNVTVMVVQL